MYNYAYNPYTGRVEYVRISAGGYYPQTFGQSNNLTIEDTANDVRESVKGIVSVIAGAFSLIPHTIARLEADIIDVLLPFFTYGINELVAYPLRAILLTILKPTYGDIADAVADEIDRRYRVQRVIVTAGGAR